MSTDPKTPKTPPEPKTAPKPEVVTIEASKLDELMRRLNALEDRNQRADLAPDQAPPEQPVYNAGPPKAGHQRVRIKMAGGRALRRSCYLGEPFDGNDPLHGLIGKLFAYQVVDVPHAFYEKLRAKNGAHFRDLDIIELVPDKPATRPFQYESKAAARKADPRFKHLSYDQILRNQERIERSKIANQGTYKKAK